MGNEKEYTVGELITKLSTFDKGTLVVISDAENDSYTTGIKVYNKEIASITDPDEDFLACVISFDNF